MARIGHLAGAGLGALLAGALVACSGGGKADADGDGKVSMGEAAKRAEAAGLKPTPGLYKATVTMTGIDIPAMPAGMEGHGAGTSTNLEYCLTKEDADKGFEDMLKQGQDKSCSYERFALDGGKLDAVMVCDGDQGKMRMEMLGSATPTSSKFDASMAMNMAGQGEATMKFSAVHERVGDCPAG